MIFAFSFISPGIFSRAARSALGRVAFCTVLITMSGCGSILSSAGPSSNAITSDTDEPDGRHPYTVIDLSAQTIAPYMLKPEKAPTHEVLPASAPEIRLLPGDTLTVTIADSTLEAPLFAPLANGGTVFNDVRVDANGRISLPYVGSLSVVRLAGGSRVTYPSQSEGPRDGACRSRAVERRHLEFGAGRRRGQGARSFRRAQRSAHAARRDRSAGGPVLEPHLIRVVVRNGKSMQTFHYDELLQSVNPVVSPRSEIVVERDRKRFVAMGAVGQPGLHDLPSDTPNLLETLGSVGGLQERIADASGVFIFRFAPRKPGEAPEAQVFRLDMKRPEAIFLAKQFLVRPEDAIYVTNAAVYEWQKIISPIVQVLVLGRAVSDF